MSKALENPVPQRRHSACDQWILITTTSVRLEPFICNQHLVMVFSGQGVILICLN